MNQWIWNAISASTAAILSGGLVLYRIRRKNSELLKLKLQVIEAESNLKSHLNELVENQSNKKDTWVRPTLAEVRRLDFNLWRVVEVDGTKQVVINQLWHLLQWLTTRENPAFKDYLDKYESTGSENRNRLILLFNDKKVPEELRSWMHKSLDKEVVEKHGETVKLMKEYIGLRKKIKSFPRLPF